MARAAGIFSEDRPLGWDPVVRRAIGRAMEWPDSCPKRKYPLPGSGAVAFVSFSHERVN